MRQLFFLMFLIATSVDADTVVTPYEPIEVEEKVILDLINSQAMQRLEGVHQYGSLTYAKPTEDYSRYDHSLGVFYLLREAGVSLDQQIAGLLHDVSHTAFSHVGDYVFNHVSQETSFQDEIHVWYLEHTDISPILRKHGYVVRELDPHHIEFSALEKQLPDLCADRIDYILQGALRRQLITEQEFRKILADLRFEKGQWFLTDSESAKKLAMASLIMTEHLWGSPWSLMVGELTAEVLHRAFEIQILSRHDFMFSTDDKVWNILIASSDSVIQKKIEQIRNIEDCYRLTGDGSHRLILKGKFRGVDPFVKTEDGLKRLTCIDDAYRDKYHEVKRKILAGWGIIPKHSDKSLKALV